MINSRWIVAVTVLLCACKMTKEKADMIILNANIYTVDMSFSRADAMAIRDGRFLEVGNASQIEAKYSSGQIIDAKGRTILPGLIDAHCHFYNLGLKQQTVDLVGTKSYSEVLSRVLSFHNQAPGEFIMGYGWDQNDWEQKDFPVKKELDSLFPDIPVALRRVDGHALLVNQKALDLAGIDGNTRVAGGEVITSNGVPTGVLIDSPMRLVLEQLPAPDREAQISALRAAEKICLDQGLTTVNDAGLDRQVIELIDSLQQSGNLRIRVYAMVSNTPENLDYYLKEGIVKTEKLHVRSIKVYGDGALGSRGAALRTSYSDQDGHFGAMITPAAEMEELAGRIAASEFQMNTHAIGDSANTVVLKAYQKALKGETDRRWKVEHAQVISTGDFDLFNENMIPSIQPTHATSDMYWANKRLGKDRMIGAYAYRLLLLKAGRVALGTDFPVEEVNPFHTFYAAVARRDHEGFPAEGFQMQDALSREEALRGMTIWAAYSNFEEEEKGSIEAGKLADFIILDKDIMTIPEKEISGVKALKVYLDGEVAE